MIFSSNKYPYYIPGITRSTAHERRRDRPSERRAIYEGGARLPRTNDRRSNARAKGRSADDRRRRRANSDSPRPPTTTERTDYRRSSELCGRRLTKAAQGRHGRTIDSRERERRYDWAATDGVANQATTSGGGGRTTKAQGRQQTTQRTDDRRSSGLHGRRSTKAV